MNKIIEMQYNFLLYTSNTRDVRGDIFKIIVAIPPKIDTANEGLSEGLNEGLKSLLIMIEKNPGIQANNLFSILEKRPIKTIEGQIKKLIDSELIERGGSRKTGRYYLTEKMKKIIK